MKKGDLAIFYQTETEGKYSNYKLGEYLIIRLDKDQVLNENISGDIVRSSGVYEPGYHFKNWNKYCFKPLKEEHLDLYIHGERF